ncbi:DUF1742-domain-containing protein [Mycena epipterygia]|nr:DUF1742-domain-containing protein [Mycena epipterygia]
MSFTNLYYKRVTSTPGPCYVCHKPTTTVLATINTVDFIYTCPTHLTDPGFSSPFVDPEAANKPALSQEDIGKVVADWEDHKDSKDTDEDKAKANDKSKDSSTSPKISGSFSPKPASTHERFTLHRDMFAMRLRDHRKRKQTAQAKELAPQLPRAPRGTL